MGELLVFAGGAVSGVRPADVDGWLAAARLRGAGPATRAQVAQAVYRFLAEAAVVADGEALRRFLSR